MTISELRSVIEKAQAKWIAIKSVVRSPVKEKAHLMFVNARGARHELQAPINAAGMKKHHSWLFGDSNQAQFSIELGFDEPQILLVNAIRNHPLIRHIDNQMNMPLASPKIVIHKNPQEKS